ncbi:head fiber protein [Microbacterium sp. T32]|uniref:head fiber protein n=1 Tax=Microbacterium sp. T32 TaxID=1776083 RepID=UPI0007AB9936|nr:head fiber protein [Microbacterium sp. T32]KZE41347.1 hypothetical protein AVW09_01825 [Microbacterium sp. T32]
MSKPKPISLSRGTAPAPGENTPQPFAVVGDLPAATPTIAGGVKKGVAVANATDAASTQTSLNALLASLRTAGVIA